MKQRDRHAGRGVAALCGLSLLLLAGAMALPAVVGPADAPERRAVVRVDAGALAPGRAISFNRDIRPILSDKCFACHGFDSNTREAGLRLDERAAAIEALAIVPGDADASELIARVTSDHTRLVMPPPSMHKPVTDAEAALLRRWIDDGAAYEPHWAFIPPTPPALPEVGNPDWVRNGIDAFVLARLEAEGLSPSPEASRRTLIRRVYLDLIGLPPTPEQTEAFVNDARPDAYERLVDRLLADPHYGERMAMPWLDAARYADSNSYQFDDNRFAWPWRDWLIRTLNDNRPFDEVIVEMLAGDLLPEPTQDQRLATAFNRHHFINAEGGAIREEVRFNYVLDRVETTSTALLGLTYACAQCHDHKYDPVSHEDYYQFFAFFGQTDEDGRTHRRLDTWDFRYNLARPMMRLSTPEQEAELARLKAVEDARYAEFKPHLPRLERERMAWARSLSEDELVALDPLLREMVRFSLYRDNPPLNAMRYKIFDHVAEHVADVEAEWLPFYRAWIEAYKARTAHEETMPWVMTMGDRKTPREIRVRDRGLYSAPVGDPVQPGLPDALGGLPDGLPRNRLGLARWVVGDANPLTARVLVNRLWQQFFGVGLVKTPEDFGLQGALPSHPGLLDYLAVRYRTDWDTKAIVRLIVTSATYRQSSAVSPGLLARDPENALLARGARFRLPAMLIRDQALSAAGLLNDTMFGPPVYPYQPEGLWIEASFGRFQYIPSTGAGLYRRGLYTFFRRTLAPPNLFDNANRQACTVKPSRTNTPLHALITLNDPTYVEAARGLALRVLDELPDDQRNHFADHRDALINRMFQYVLLRDAEARELNVLTNAYMRELAWYRLRPDEADAYLGVGELDTPGDVEPAHLAALSAVAQTILNLDEALTKE